MSNKLGTNVTVGTYNFILKHVKINKIKAGVKELISFVILYAPIFVHLLRFIYTCIINNAKQYIIS